MAIARLAAGFAALVLLGGGDEFAAGVRAYQQGHFAEAYEAFSAAEQACGDDATAELLYNRALAALQVGQLRVAEYSAEKAVVRGGAGFAGLREFLFGCAAFARCERAEAEGSMLDADPTAFGRAMAHCVAARDFWQRAAMSRVDWPQARRNAERAAVKLEELRQKKEDADRQRRARVEKQPQPQPEPPKTEGPREEVEQTPVPQQQPTGMPPDLLDVLLAKLAQVEKDKRAARRARQRARTGVARDW